MPPPPPPPVDHARIAQTRASSIALGIVLAVGGVFATDLAAGSLSWAGLTLPFVLAHAIGVLLVASTVVQTIQVRWASTIFMLVAGLAGVVACAAGGRGPLSSLLLTAGSSKAAVLQALSGGLVHAAAVHAVFLASLGAITEGVARIVILRAPPDGVGLSQRLFGFRSFVAWRYLLVFKVKVSTAARVAPFVGIAMIFALAIDRVRPGPPVLASGITVLGTILFLLITWCWGILRHVKAAFVLYVLGIVVMLGAITAIVFLTGGRPPADDLWAPQLSPVVQWWIRALNITALVGAGLAILAWFFGTLRAFFTFFTTVPMGGVWIGTAALVIVLAVMSGFETDLRDKILGSNAHIQITRERGEFVDWREVKARVDNIPGVVASTPYAVSEVVIAAHNNGMNVIIKGIDPETVGAVSDLVDDIEGDGKEAMRRLEPLVADPFDLTVPEAPSPPSNIDPPPPDLPRGGDPIDFSPPAVEPSPRPDPSTGGATLEPPVDLDDEEARPAIDPPPDDLATSDALPIDYSGDGRDEDGVSTRVIRATDFAIEPSLSKRTQSLHGVLIGSELVKQTLMQRGEEVHIVSPLSDPSNPDATGTPIPFNRNYRVAGVFYTGMYEYDLKYVYVTLDSLQDFLDRGDTIDGIEVRIRDADDTERYIPTDAGPGLIRQALGDGYRVVDWRELNRSLFSALEIEKIAMFAVLCIVILVAAFSIVGNLIMVVVEKGREIALLKTLGASDVSVTQLFAIQGLMIGIIGTALGLVFGLVACWLADRFGLPLNPDVYYIDRLPIHVDYESVAAAAAVGVFVSIAATLYPAWMAARVRPAAGMRQ